MASVDEPRDERPHAGRDAGDLDARIYVELRELARAQLRRERADHTLQATALVHEAWMRLGGAQPNDTQSTGAELLAQPPRFENARHFFGAAAEAMRRVLVDHARARGSDKRGGGAQRVTLGAIDEPFELADEELLALDEALATLAAEDARAAEVARLRFLCGLSAPETASALGISERSVHREWTYARARLFDLMSAEPKRRHGADDARSRSADAGGDSDDAGGRSSPNEDRTR